MMTTSRSSAHHRFSPSSTPGRMCCPGYIGDSTETQDASFGRETHERLAAILDAIVCSQPYDYSWFEQKSEKFAMAAKYYVHAVMTKARQEKSRIYVEHTIHGTIRQRGNSFQIVDLFGTADAIIHDKANGTVYGFDIKSGCLSTVSHEWQMRVYGELACQTFAASRYVWAVHYLSDGNLQSYEGNAQDPVYVHTILQAAKDSLLFTDTSDGRPNPHCGFCARLWHCKAVSDRIAAKDSKSLSEGNIADLYVDGRLAQKYADRCNSICKNYIINNGPVLLTTDQYLDVSPIKQADPEDPESQATYRLRLRRMNP